MKQILGWRGKAREKRDTQTLDLLPLQPILSMTSISLGFCVCVSVRLSVSRSLLLVSRFPCSPDHASAHHRPSFSSVVPVSLIDTLIRMPVVVGRLLYPSMVSCIHLLWQEFSFPCSLSNTRRELCCYMVDE